MTHSFFPANVRQLLYLIRKSFILRCESKKASGTINTKDFPDKTTVFWHYGFSTTVISGMNSICHFRSCKSLQHFEPHTQHGFHRMMQRCKCCCWEFKINHAVMRNFTHQSRKGKTWNTKINLFLSILYIPNPFPYYQRSKRIEYLFYSEWFWDVV